MKLFKKDRFKQELIISIVRTATSVTKIFLVSTNSMYLKERYPDFFEPSEFIVGQIQCY